MQDSTGYIERQSNETCEDPYVASNFDNDAGNKRNSADKHVCKDYPFSRTGNLSSEVWTLAFRK